MIFAVLMPPTMLGLMFFLARIEDRHLVARGPRVSPVPLAVVDNETPSTTEAA